MPRQPLSLLEAVGNLHHLADLKAGDVLALASKEELKLFSVPLVFSRVDWIDEHNLYSVDAVIRDTLSVVLQQLRQLCDSEGSTSTKEVVDSGVASVYSLVGNATSKVSRCTHLFAKKTGEGLGAMREYQQLQSVFNERFSGRKLKVKKVSQAKPLLHWRRSAHYEQRESVEQELRTLEGVESDYFYEFFLMRKKDGSTWYDSELIRNMQLIYHLERTRDIEDDPLAKVRFWKDRRCQFVANYLYQKVLPWLGEFFKEYNAHDEHPVAHALSKSIMALLLASNANNLLHNGPAKDASSYFKDYQYFYRQALALKESKEMLKAPAKSLSDYERLMRRLMVKMAHVLYTRIPYYQEAYQDIMDFIDDEKLAGADLRVNTLWEHYQKIQEVIGAHPSGPIMKAFQIIELELVAPGFDPLIQENLPYQIYNFNHPDGKMHSLHIPSPTTQLVVDHAVVTEDFKAYLKSLEKDEEDHLIINFQDRTSWVEYSRCQCIEKLSENYKSVYVVTLAKNTDFYHQEGHYAQENTSSDFIDQFCDHLQDPSTGYYFSPTIYGKLFPSLAKEMMHSILRLFFDSKNVLSKHERLDFIEIFYTFLCFKILTWIKPFSYSLISKDSVDVAIGANATLFAAFKILLGRFDERSLRQVTMMLYSMPLSLRERSLHIDTFQRMIGALSQLEGFVDKYGQEKAWKAISDPQMGLMDARWAEAQINFTSFDEDL